ncbi:hypothetical protein CYY_000438 [Polysphondylium violaceum]|uniref:Carboxylic ester hydrolase n=1 Tax=Polysphondylium violaceum TaxID=133409 RepID=A0A8J4Q1I7_9MYCE|nr:hypothetical protein CYY_000438 [Polysphondylium violaceum]
MKYQLIFLICALVMLTTATTTENPLKVVSSSGIYYGKNMNGSRAYLGIPFAKPPVGALRFKPPQKASFSLNYQATQWPLACYQTGITNQTLMSEDCLYLNVFTPTTAKPFPGLPVMVFIHGGRYWTGQTSQFPGDLLAHLGDVVVVSIQYRLNIFGFQPFDENTNNGLLDQQLALKWVRENIFFFGGNPSSVTIFGESAGGSSVLHHLTVPSSYPLYDKAILQSAWQWLIPTAQVSKVKAATWAATKGCANTTPTGTPDYEAILDCLKALPSQTILPTTGNSDFFVPMIDNVLINDLPLASIKNGYFNKNAKIIIGHNYDEGHYMAYSRVGGYKGPSFPVTDTTYYNSLTRYLTVYLTPAEANQIIALYEPVKTQLANNWLAASEFFGDYYISCGSILAAEYLNQQNASLKTFIFNYTSPNYPAVESFLAASHGNELPYIFYQWIYTYYPFSVGDYLMSDRMMKAWVDFAATSNTVSYVNNWPSTYPNAMYFGPDPTDFSASRPYTKPICDSLRPIFE